LVVVIQDEAFALWKSVWASIYAEGTPSRQLLDSIIGSYFLVSVIDNNFVSGNIFALFDQAIELSKARSITA
jgi:methylenetetrahydrofolate reductase (NADPH)